MVRAEEGGGRRGTAVGIATTNFVSTASFVFTSSPAPGEESEERENERESERECARIK